MSQTLINLVGKRVGERAAVLGVMFSSDDALSTGLVDMVVDQENLMAEAQKQMKQWLAVPGEKLTDSKPLMLTDTVNFLSFFQMQEELLQNTQYVEKCFKI